jgi:tetratricopeptide (TPR) repeat protein
LLATLAVAAYAFYYHFIGSRPWRQAQQALADYDFQSARSRLEECVTLWPKDPEVHFLLARTCRRMGDFAAAGEHLEQASRYRYSRDEIALEESLLQVETNLFQAEGELLQRLATVPPETPLIVEALIRAYLRSRFLEKAYGVASQWVAAFPDDWYPRSLRGVVAAAMQGGDPARIAEIIDDLKGVLAKKPDHPETSLALAELMFHNGQEREALPHYQAYLRSRPDDVRAVVALVRCQRFLGDGAGARAHLEEWLAAHSDVRSAEIYHIRGQLALDAGALTEARDWLLRSSRLPPKNPETLHLLAVVHRLRKETAQADKYSQEEKACEEDYALAKKLTHEITRLGKTGNVPESEAAKLAELYYNLGSALVRLDQSEPALNSLQFALRFQPGHEGAQRLVAELQRRTR